MKEINSYLIFNGNCRDAMKFYEKCLGAELHMMTFGEGPCPDGKSGPPPETKDLIMHARLSKGSLVLMASDNMPGMDFHQGNNCSLALGCESIAEIETLFAALTEKSTIKMPLQETFWATRFAMFIDQFGVHWMLNLDKPEASQAA